MKKFQFWSLLLGLTFGSLAFTACSSSDDDESGNEGGGGPESEVAGTWKISLTADVPDGKGGKTTAKYEETMSFNEDGSFAVEQLDEWNTGTKYEGNWSKLGSDKVVVELKRRFNGDENGNFTPDESFEARNDTLGYFFKGNAIFCESVMNDGYFAYTRSGALPFSGYGDYAGSPLLGSWIGEDFASDGTHITNRLELRKDGTFVQTMDNHLGWSEGTAGYYILDGNRMMIIHYYFISKMNSETGDWEVVGFRMRGGAWNTFEVKDDVLYYGNLESMSGEMEFMVREGKELGSSPVGHWYADYQNYITNTTENEYWEIESDNTVRHWWVTDGNFRKGTMGTYSLETTKDDYSEKDITILRCHWDYWLADSGNNKNPKQGEETGRGESDYDVKYVYSKISDALLVQWPGSYDYTRFKRMK